MPWLQITDRDTGAVERVVITKPSFVIGKLGSNDLCLDKQNISRAHCQIVSINGNYIIRDLGSRNGTYVEGRRIAGEVPLQDGTRIDLGAIHIIFHATQAEDTRAKPAPGTRSRVQAQRTARAATAAAPGDTRRLVPSELKKKIHERLLADLDLRHTDITEDTEDELREKAERVVSNIVATLGDEIPVWLPQRQLIKEIVDEAVGLGPIEDLLRDPEIDEIMVNDWDRIYVERRGKIELTDKSFTDRGQVIHIIRRIIAPLGRRIDESSPMVDARLRDGSRVNAIIAPLALTGPTLTIRKFSQTPFTEKDLIGFGTLTQQIVDFLKLAVTYRSNILISGGTGSGKTTLLNVVSAFIPHTERIVTIEDAAELKLQQPHVVSLEAKPPNIEGEGAIPIRELVRNSLRMRPDRIIIGECRGGEALDMLQAMNTGHDGSLTTLHANSERDAIARLETLVLMAGMDLPSRAIREQIASALNFIVHEARFTDGTRKIAGISEVTGMEGDVVTMQPIYEFEQSGFGPKGEVLGRFRPTGAIPKFVHDLRARKIPVDMALFQEKKAGPPPPPRRARR